MPLEEIVQPRYGSKEGDEGVISMVRPRLYYYDALTHWWRALLTCSNVCGVHPFNILFLD